jgi:hypothetical protein
MALRFMTLAYVFLRPLTARDAICRGRWHRSGPSGRRAGGKRPAGAQPTTAVEAPRPTTL